MNRKAWLKRRTPRPVMDDAFSGLSLPKTRDIIQSVPSAKLRLNCLLASGGGKQRYRCREAGVARARVGVPCAWEG